MSIKKKHRGFSLISVMLGLSLLTVMLASNMKLLSFISTSSGKSDSDELLNQSTRLTEMFASRVNRGGAYLVEGDDTKGIQLCALNSSGSQCSKYSNQTQNFCLTLPVQIGNGALATIDIKGFRLLNGVLQQRSQVDVKPLKTFDTAAFCKNNNEWENLHNGNDFTVSSLKLCRFKASTFASITANYATQCESVLAAEPIASAYWVALFDITPKTIGANALQQTRIIQLFNDTRVTTL